jgi:hypothetical protein
MPTAKSRLRDITLDDLTEQARRAPAWGEAVERDGGMQIVADYYLTWDMVTAAKAIFKGRWRRPETREAIANARLALKALGDAMQTEIQENRNRNRK